MKKKLNRNNRYQFPLLYVGLKKFIFYTEILSQNFDYNAVNFTLFSTIISLKKIDQWSQIMSKENFHDVISALVIVMYT